MKTVSRTAILLATLLLAATPALAQTSPLSVIAEVHFETATQGGFQQAECEARNVGTEPMLVQVTGTITYADGTQQTILRPGQPILLGPDEAILYFIFIAVPEDAALGTATFECSVRAFGIQGGAVQGSDTATFEVVPA